MTGSAESGASATISGDIDFSGGSLTHQGKNIGATHQHTDPQGGTTGGVV